MDALDNCAIIDVTIMDGVPDIFVDVLGGEYRT